MKTNSLAKVAEEISLIFIDQNMSIKDIHSKFYELMRKHGIKQNKKENRDSPVAWALTNPAWDMCYVYFLSIINEYFRAKEMFLEIPEDLKY